MRVASVAFVSLLTLGFAFGVRADDPKDKPKESKPDQQAGKVREMIVGKWAPTKDKDDTTIEFTKDGKIKILGKQILAIDGEYKLLDDSTLQVKLTYGGEEKTFKLKTAVTGDELTTQVIEGGKEMDKESFKRVK